MAMMFLRGPLSIRGASQIDALPSSSKIHLGNKNLKSLKKYRDLKNGRRTNKPLMGSEPMQGSLLQEIIYEVLERGGKLLHIYKKKWYDIIPSSVRRPNKSIDVRLGGHWKQESRVCKEISKHKKAYQKLTKNSKKEKSDIIKKIYGKFHFLKQFFDTEWWYHVPYVEAYDRISQRLREKRQDKEKTRTDLGDPIKELLDISTGSFNSDEDDYNAALDLILTDYELEPFYASRPLPIDAVCEEVAAEDVHLGPVHASRSLLIDAVCEEVVVEDVHLGPVHTSRPMLIDVVREEGVAEDVHFGPVHASRPLLIDTVCEEVAVEDVHLGPVHASRPLPIDAVCEEVAVEDVHLGPVHASRPLLIDTVCEEVAAEDVHLGPVHASRPKMMQNSSVTYIVSSSIGIFRIICS